ncbi:MAG: hypothetical protein HOV68_31310 [Streptomycetaceae bacterium]|nr:hypothetical protein [Streptomycetaceae bacterium]
MSERGFPDVPVGSAEAVDVPAQAVPARAGREAAFTDFYRATMPALVAFLVVRGARLADAADVAQEAMAAAYRRWHALDHPRAWVFRVSARSLARRPACSRNCWAKPVTWPSTRRAAGSRQPVAAWNAR